VLPRISTEFLSRVIDGKTLAHVHVGVEQEEFTYAFD
jgi:type VI secretion system protein VasG